METELLSSQYLVILHITQVTHIPLRQLLLPGKQLVHAVESNFSGDEGGCKPRKIKNKTGGRTFSSNHSTSNKTEWTWLHSYDVARAVIPRLVSTARAKLLPIDSIATCLCWKTWAAVWPGDGWAPTDLSIQEKIRSTECPAFNPHICREKWSGAKLR